MTYLRRLIHTAAVHRATGERQPEGDVKYTYDDDTPVEDMEAVPCYFAPGETRTVQQLFGREAQLDGIVFFEGGTDIKPGIGDASGLNDKLVIKDQNAATIGTFLVQGTQNPAMRGRVLVAGVKRADR